MTAEGLLHLPEEGCARLEAAFTQQGAGISAVFHETLPPASSGAQPATAELSALTFDGIARISLDSFVQSESDPNLFVAKRRMDGLESTLVSAVAKDPEAAVTIGGVAGPVRTVAQGTENGSVTVQPGRAGRSQTVVITTKPDEG